MFEPDFDLIKVRRLGRPLARGGNLGLETDCLHPAPLSRVHRLPSDGKGRVRVLPENACPDRLPVERQDLRFDRIRCSVAPFTNTSIAKAPSARASIATRSMNCGGTASR